MISPQLFCAVHRQTWASRHKLQVVDETSRYCSSIVAVRALGGRVSAPHGSSWRNIIYSKAGC